MPKRHQTEPRRTMKTKNAPAKGVATDEAIEQVLWDCLAEIAFVGKQKVEQRLIADPSRPEIVGRAHIGGQEWLILAEGEAYGQPRLARQAVDNLLKSR